VAGAILFDRRLSFLVLGDPNVRLGPAGGRTDGTPPRSLHLRLPAVAIMGDGALPQPDGDGLNDASNPKLRDR